MSKYDLGGVPAVPGLVVLAAILFGVACAGPSTTMEWPDTQTLIEAPRVSPEERPRLVRADNGMLFVVGDLQESPKVGDVVFGRYDGDWPVEQMERPALFAGVVAEVRTPQIVHVHPLHQFPEIDHQELRVEFATSLGEETMGKGVATVDDVDFDGPAHLDLSLGGEAGIRSGDMYGILGGLSEESESVDTQMTRRLIGVCMVVDVEAESSRCRLRQGHPQHKWAGTPRSGHQAIFLEPTFGTSPNTARVLISPTGDETVDAVVLENLTAYLTRFPGGQVEVETFDDEVDARETEFYRWNRRVQVDEPSLLVGVTLVDGDDGTRVVVNYTGLGSAIGPGMVAAPPEGGVDMGSVEEISEQDWTGIASVLMGAVLVYRGQNAEALSHLHDALRDPRLAGPLRWHARDQYAMRWAALDRFEEAMWLVMEDEAVAVAADDEKARQNALGTLVRLHHHIDQDDQALAEAKRFILAYSDDRQSANYVFALAMVAEMAAAAGRFDEAEEALDELDELCPDGCEGDMVYMLAGVYWAADDENPEMQDRIVDRMVEISQGDRGAIRAAARMFQGWTFMRDDNFEQALMAFLEARRLYEGEKSSYGAARAQFFVAVTQGVLGNRQDAFERGLDALEFMTGVRDYGSTVRIYGQLSNLYLGIDPSQPPERFLGAAPRVLRAHLDARLSTGDYGWASEAAFGYGVFMRFVGDLDQARQALQRGVVYGLRVANLDVVARCHVQLALVARMAGDEDGFHQEMERAQIIAEAIDDPALDEEIDTVLEPPEYESDEPTQFL